MKYFKAISIFIIVYIAIYTLSISLIYDIVVKTYNVARQKNVASETLAYFPIIAKINQNETKDKTSYQWLYYSEIGKINTKTTIYNISKDKIGYINNNNTRYYNNTNINRVNVKIIWEHNDGEQCISVEDFSIDDHVNKSLYIVRQNKIIPLKHQYFNDAIISFIANIWTFLFASIVSLIVAIKYYRKLRYIRHKLI